MPPESLPRLLLGEVPSRPGDGKTGLADLAPVLGSGDSAITDFRPVNRDNIEPDRSRVCRGVRWKGLRSVINRIDPLRGLVDLLEAWSLVPIGGSGRRNRQQMIKDKRWETNAMYIF